MSARGEIRTTMGLLSEDASEEQIKAAFRHGRRVFEWHDDQLRCAVCHTVIEGDAA